MITRIIGSAGHVDHGKTSVIRALSGFDCDTHPEEKTRGITIHLGFTNLQINDLLLGIVDVPGHKDFINTMVAGAYSIDFVLFVIAADSGIMQQTIEHLYILNLLGIQRGIIVLNKVDLVEQNYIEIHKEEIADLVKDTFLESAPIIEVSTKTNIGIDTLKEEIYKMASLPNEKAQGFLPRLIIDRMFSKKGIGTIINGTVTSGMFYKEDAVYIGQSEILCTIRRMEQYGIEVSKCKVGERTSLNIVNNADTTIEKGMTVSTIPLHFTNLIDVRLIILPNTRIENTWSHAILIGAGIITEAKIHLLNLDFTQPNMCLFAQIHLARPIPFFYLDRFILRSTSADITIGGGIILDTCPLHHRKRTVQLINQLSVLADELLSSAISNEVHKSILPVSLSELTILINQPIKVLREHLPQSDDIVIYHVQEATILWHNTYLRNVQLRIIKGLHQYHKVHTLSSTGMSREALYSLVKKYHCRLLTTIFPLILEAMVTTNQISFVQNTYIIYQYQVTLTEDIKHKMSWVNLFFKNCNATVPLMSEMQRLARQKGITDKELKQILQFYSDNKKIIPVEDSYLLSSVVTRYRTILLTYLMEQQGNEGITIAQFRDLIQKNRKLCLYLANIFDAEGITYRQGDIRNLTAKGRSLFESD